MSIAYVIKEDGEKVCYTGHNRRSRHNNNANDNNNLCRVAAPFTIVPTHNTINTTSLMHNKLYCILLLLLQPFYGSLDSVRDYPGELSRYQKGKTKTNLDFLEQETVSGSGISWAICKSAPCPRQVTTPTSYQSVFTGRMPFYCIIMPYIMWSYMETVYEYDCG